MFNIPANQLDSFNYLLTHCGEWLGGAFLKVFVPRYTLRAYHNLNHLAMVHKHTPSLNQSKDITIAVLIHDFAHPFATNSEWKSLGVLSQIDLTYTDIDVDAVIEMVRTTCEDVDVDASSQYSFFRDADRAILGQSPIIYLNYTQELREEAGAYVPISDAEFIEKRKKWLLKTLSKQIYLTDHMRFVYEEQAIENITNELKSYEN